jgi:hypothetical protein
MACTQASNQEGKEEKKNYAEGNAEVKEKIKNDSWHWDMVNFPLDSIKTGDLMLRHSTGFSSDIFMQSSKREAKFSHSGMAIRNPDGTVYVYHMLGGVDNPQFNLKKDSLQAWCSPVFAQSFAIYRYDLSDAERGIIDSMARYYYKSNLTFDMDFDLKTDDRMYCSEFIYKMLVLATKNKNYIPLSVENGKPFVGIDDLYLNPNSKKLLEHEHKKSS